MRLIDDEGKLEKKTIILVVLAIIAIIAIITTVIIVVVNKDRSGVISEVSKKEYEYFPLTAKDGSVGVINKKGEKIIDTKYAYVFIPNQSMPVFFCFEDENSYHVFDEKGNDRFTEYNDVSYITISDTTMDMEKEVLTYEVDGKYGMISFEGKEITKPIYDSIVSLPNKPGFLLVKKEGLCGVIDSAGQIIIDPIYNSIKGDEYSSEKDGYKKTGYIISEKTENGILYGYINYAGKLLVEPKYELIERAHEYSDDDIYLLFRNLGKWGVIKNKKVIIKPKYQDISYNDLSNVFAVNRNGKYGFYSNDGSEILPINYTSYTIAGNYISVNIENNMFLYDLHGNLVNTNNYKSVIGTDNPSFFITKNENDFYSIISKDVQLDEHYKDISYAFDNFFIFANQEGRYGILNVYSGVEVEPQYDFIVVLENGKVLQAVSGTTVDIYSQNIEKVVSMDNAKIEMIDKKYAVIYNDNDRKYVNDLGQIVSNTEVYPNLKLYAIQNEEGKWGFKTNEDAKLVDYEYDFVTELNEYGYSGVVKDGKWGVLNQDGTEIVEPQYDISTYYSPKFIGKYLLEETETVYCSEM